VRKKIPTFSSKLGDFFLKCEYFNKLFSSIFLNTFWGKISHKTNYKCEINSIMKLHNYVNNLKI